MPDFSHCFDEFYFNHHCGEPYRRDEVWLMQFEGIAQRIVEEFTPKTALDAGCVAGFLVESLRNWRVEAFGVDISEYAIEHVNESVKPYCWVDSVSDPIPQRYSPRPMMIKRQPTSTSSPLNIGWIGSTVFNFIEMWRRKREAVSLAEKA